jgi:hypothetical protein
LAARGSDLPGAKIKKKKKRSSEWANNGESKTPRYQKKKAFFRVMPFFAHFSTRRRKEAKSRARATDGASVTSKYNKKDLSGDAGFHSFYDDGIEPRVARGE